MLGFVDVARAAHRPPADAGAVAGARGPVRPRRRLQWLLVHVLADGVRLRQAAARGEPTRLSGDRPEGAAAGAGGVGWRSRRRLVPGDAARGAGASAGAPRRRRRRLGDLVLLRAARL